MPEPGKIYVPMDFRNLKKGMEPFVFQVDEDDEPPCMVLQIFNKQAHIEIRLDESSMDNLFDELIKKRVELTKRLAFQRGAASALRRKK